MLEIYIPTLGRKVQETYQNLPASLQARVIFVCSRSEDAPTVPCKEIWVPGTQGIAATRQAILERATGAFAMLDDDLRFATRRTDDPTKFEDASDYDINLAFERLDGALKQVAHSGMATREGGNRYTMPYVWNTRILRILGYHAPTLKEKGIRFDRLPVMEDFDVALQLLRLGHPSCSLNWIVHDQKSSNAAGGCSTYRTMEVQAKAAHALQALHPQFVTIVKKQTKTAWNGQERTDVRIQWKRALEAGVLDHGTGINSEEAVSEPAPSVE